MKISAYKITDQFSGTTYDLMAPYGMAAEDLDVEQVEMEIDESLEPTTYMGQINGLVTRDGHHTYNLQQAVLAGLAKLAKEGT